MNAQTDNTIVINMLSVLTASGRSRVTARAATLEMDFSVKVIQVPAVFHTQLLILLRINGICEWINMDHVLIITSSYYYQFNAVKCHLNLSECSNKSGYGTTCNSVKDRHRFFHFQF